MAKSDKELSTPEKREKKLKDYYKKLPLFKVKDILLGIKRKSQVYKDMGQKVPKNLISIQRSLYYIIKKKEKEQMEKAKQTANTVNEKLGYKVNRKKKRRIKEDIFLKKDKENDRIIVFSDMPDKKSKYKETISLKDEFKRLGLKWDGAIGHWTGPYTVLTDLNKLIKSHNKIKDIIDKLENLEDFIADSDTSQSQKSLLLKNLNQYIEDLANATDQRAMDAEIKRYLTFWSNFYHYSPYNTLLIRLQKPNATQVASFTDWKKKGRLPKKGTAIYILAPIITKDKDKVSTKDQEKVDKAIDKGGRLVGFKTVPVFDISDTFKMKGAKDVPEVPKWYADNDKSEVAEQLSNRLKEFASDLKINLTQSDSKSGEKGYSAGGHINMSSGVEGAAYASTLVHELAHELMHWKKSSTLYVGSRREPMDSDKYLTSAAMELQAESVSYTVMKHFGLPCKHHPTYLVLWKANSDLILKNLNDITRCARFIIEGVEALSSDETEELNESIRLAGLAKGFVSEKSLGKENPKK